MTAVKVKFNYSKKNWPKPFVICDSPVWYDLASGKYQHSNDSTLIATSLTLAEIASSPMMINDPVFYQNVIKAIYGYSGPIITSNPFDFVIANHDPSYKYDSSATKRILTDFSKIMNRDFSKDVKIEDELIQKIKKGCQEIRGKAQDFADFGNVHLPAIRKNINLGIGQTSHLEQDTTAMNRKMIEAVFKDYLKNVDYKMDFEGFDWQQIEFFMVVTELYFKKLETTKDMKIDRNDAVDWLNMLYVRPGDKFFTVEKKRWRPLILSDNRISHYLYGEPA